MPLVPCMFFSCLALLRLLHCVCPGDACVAERCPLRGGHPECGLLHCQDRARLRLSGPRALACPPPQVPSVVPCCGVGWGEWEECRHSKVGKKRSLSRILQVLQLSARRAGAGGCFGKGKTDISPPPSILAASRWWACPTVQGSLFSAAQISSLATDAANVCIRRAGWEGSGVPLVLADLFFDLLDAITYH